MHETAAERPYNSMIPARVTGRFGEHHGMTKAEAEEVVNQPYDPGDWQGVVNMSSAAYILGQDAMALELAEHAIRVYPCTPAFINLAVILGSRGRFPEASVAARMAYTSDPHDRTAATLYAEHLLRIGQWQEAWTLFHNYYDSKRVSLFSYAMSLWSGQSLKGKRLLLIEGGGFGDNFFFLRWVGELKERGAHITYLCPGAMYGLMERQWYIDRVIPTVSGQIGELRVTDYDFYVPLLALGGIMGKTVKNSMDSQPWIGATGGDELNRDRPARIGFCWQAGEASLPRPFRSLDHGQQVQITSLIQAKGHMVESLVPKEPGLGWDATARLMRGCDLIVTVDTGVAHLAGAMGLPTWVILPGFSAWYFGLNSLTTPLYPTMRLFRNHIRGTDIAVNACCKVLESWNQ